MNIIRNAVIVVPTSEEHTKLASFIEAYTDVKWNGGEKLSKRSFAGPTKAYSFETDRFFQCSISFYKENMHDADYAEAIEAGTFLVSVDEYIARCIGWNDVEPECEIDFGGVL